MAPIVCLAHPGHGSTDGYTITHYFVEPEHAIFTWSFLMASFILISYYKLRKKKYDRESSNIKRESSTLPAGRRES